MNEPDTRDARTTGTTTARWWLDPALARLALGTTTRAHGGASPAAAPGQRVTPHDNAIGLDLEDPAQREIGDYELLELIGQGGMGLVYRARQRSLDREVAIKLLSAGTWAPDELVDTLRREARHAARLQHPNIVVVHEAGEHAGLVYFAMQLVRGRSLSQRLAAGEAPSHRQAATLLRTVAEAVDYAHRLGVLHLDLKPGNIVIDGDGMPLVADFGLARPIEQAIGVENEQVSGTPAYMAPEQARLHGPPLSPATDVWALGAILYELLAGAPPFDGGDAASTLQRLLAGDLRPPSQLAKVPADLEAICLKCLARDPRDRYPGARALADDLGRFLEGRNVSVRRPGALRRVARWARREPGLAAAGSLAALALLAGVAATSLQWRRAEANARHAGSALAAQRVLALQHAHALGRDQDALPGLAANLAASEAAGDDDGVARDRRRLGYTFAALPRLVDHFHLPQRLGSLALSPDGRLLAVGTLESSEILLFDTRDGRRLWQVSLAGEPAFFGSGNFQRTMHRLRFSSDGRYLVVGNWWPTPVASPSGIDQWRIEVATGALAQPQQLFAHMVDATYGADGRHALLRRMDTHRVQLWDAVRWRPLGPAVPYDPVHPGWLIAPGATFVASWTSRGVDILDARTLARRQEFPTAATAVAWTAWAASPDARWLALGNQEGAVVLADPATGAQRRLLPGPAARVHWLQFSADGRWLVAGSEEGSAWLWQRDDDFRHGRRIRVDAPVLEAAVDPDSGLVRIAGPATVSLWQLSGLADADRPALRRSPLFRHAQQIPRFASDLHAASGLFATASVDGDVRLWRLPATPLRRGAAAPQLASQLQFDGEHLVAVDGRSVTVVRAADERAASLPFEHPQSVGFAALTADGATLVTSSGRELRVFDWRHGRLRFPPLALPNSPMKLALDPAGRRVYASWTVDRGNALTEAVGAFSLADGRALAPAVESAGGFASLLPTADGRLLLASADGFALHDGASLRQLARVPVSGTQAVVANGSRVVVATAAPDAIRQFDMATSRWLADEPLVEAPVSVASSRDGRSRAALLPGNGLVRLARDGSNAQLVDVPDGSQFVRAAAFSADGSVLAQGLVDGVLLLDAASGEWMAPPLRVPIPAPDLVAQLAFSPDGTRLLGRTRFGRWLWWRLDPEARAASAVAREAQELSPVRGAAAQGEVAESRRRALRQGDPGPAANALPDFAADGCLAAQPALLRRGPGASPRQLDLTTFATLDPREHSLAPTTLTVANLCGLPLGLQRMDGVDFDVRVAIRPHLDRNKPLPSVAYAIASGIPVPAPVARVAALELLATSTTFVQDPPPESQPVQFDVVLHYADGGSARLPVRYGRDITMWTEAPPPTSRVGWYLVLPRVEAGVAIPPSINLYRVRLPNPHPERPVAKLDLEARPVTWNGASVFAITVDPVPAANAAARIP